MDPPPNEAKATGPHVGDQSDAIGLLEGDGVASELVWQVGQVDPGRRCSPPAFCADLLKALGVSREPDGPSGPLP